MKRTIPLVITAMGGFVLIVAAFIPATEGWGKVAAIWFDVLASIAFILGGGNLLRVHLQKVSDRAAGWGYSAVTIVAFLITLVVGLAKVGTRPVPQQDHYGESFAHLPLEAFPDSQVTKLSGRLASKASGVPLPASVRRQLTSGEDADGPYVAFRGWMNPNQRNDLLRFQDELEWQCLVERLYEKAQPPAPLRGKVVYYASHSALAFRGRMTDAQRSLLLEMDKGPLWKQAVEQLYELSQVQTRVPAEGVPAGFEPPEPLKDRVHLDEGTNELVATGPLSPADRDLLARQFPIARPLFGDHRDRFRRQLEALGEPLNDAQVEALNKILDGSWTADDLVEALNRAGEPIEVDRPACELLEEKRQAEARGEIPVLKPKRTVGTKTSLTDEQIAVVRSFAETDTMTVEEFLEQLRAAGPLTNRQEAAVADFIASHPTRGERNRSLWFELARKGPLSDAQQSFLLEDYRNERTWRLTVGRLFVAAHVPKYPWAGEYAAQGTAFWWIYEYVFKPLTATMFAMLAFYVASAAFRAFRAKNFEAVLLLGTAFIILLGRTFAGVVLTSWIPDSLRALRIEELSVYIMTIFNTAGNRAIMLGIALGIASTSLKVLLGVDRSYLGTQED